MNLGFDQLFAFGTNPLVGLAVAVALCCYILAIGLASLRLLYGPSAQDRILALDFIYVNGMLVIVAIGIHRRSEMAFEAALLIALFGFVGTAALAKFLLRGEVIE
ncbi:MAG: K+/H+ antiporter subunit F [Lautropia sp.]